MIKKLKNGFTLVELVIVIAVIAILAAVLIPTFAGVLARAHESARLTRARNAKDEYLTSNDKILPEDLDGYIIEVDDHYYQVSANGALKGIDSESMAFMILNEVAANITDQEVVIYTFSAPGFYNGDDFTVFTSSNISTYMTIENGLLSSVVASQFDGATKIILPNSVTSIGTNIFNDSNFADLKTLKASNLANIGDNAFKDCANLKGINSDVLIEVVGNSAFENCYAIETIGLSETATIGNNAFKNCYYLYTVVFTDDPDSIEAISAKVDKKLTTTMIVSPSASTLTLGDNVFNGCYNLNSVALPDNVTLSESTFTGSCLYEIYTTSDAVIAGSNGLTASTTILTDPALTKIRTASGVRYYDDGETCVAIGFDNTVQNIVLESDCTGVDNYAFYNSGITSIAIGSSVTSIGDYAFSECVGLTNASIYNVSTNIGNFIFLNCSNLVEISLRYSGSDMIGGNNILQGCVALTRITINVEAVNKLGAQNDYKFGRLFCDSYSSSNYDLESGYYPAENIDVIITGSGQINNYSFATFRVRAVTLANTITDIAVGAFKSCTTLETINLNNVSNYIYNEAFYGCIALNNITLENVKYIRQSAFYGCTALTEIVIPATTRELGSNAFSNSGLQSVVLNYDKTNGLPINYTSFASCSSLQTFTVSTDALDKMSTNHFSGLFNSILPNIDVTVTVTENTNYIRASAFSNFRKFKSITISDGVTEIQPSAFSYSNLTTISIPTSVTIIGYRAFEGCVSLTSVAFADTITTWDVSSNTNYNVSNAATNANNFKNAYKTSTWYKNN